MHDPLNPALRAAARRLPAGSPWYPAASAAHPDAAWAAERAVWDASDGWVDGDERVADAANAASAAVVGRILAARARTLDGLMVKARAFSWCYCGDEPEPEPGDTTDIRLAYSVVADLRRIAAEGRA